MDYPWDYTPAPEDQGPEKSRPQVRLALLGRSAPRQPPVGYASTN